MDSAAKFQRFIAGCLFITINTLFYFKYLYRVSFITGLAAVGVYWGFLYVLFFLYKKKKLVFPLWGWIGMMTLFTVTSGVILHFIPEDSLKVDRWEMIRLFWDSASQGVYPYGVHSPGGNYPGPMPFYFILSYPFYKIGEIGWITVVGLWITLLYFYKKIDRNRFGLLVLLLVSSLSVYWEIFARSTIFTNTLLFALYLFNLKKLPERSGFAFYGWAVLGGILLSTRTVFVLPLIIWGMYVLIRKEISWTRIVKWGLCFIAAFVATFLPFYWMDPHTFMVLNPFITQGDVLLPFSYTVCFAGIAFIFPFFCKKYADIWFYSGLLLFLTITAYVIYALADNGVETFLTNGADISYYLFCFPFLLKTIINGDEK